ncbi:subunit 17 of mediator complex-domain-containing protein [Gilbertella persicaria]|uniref:subunit 17 of mediator complex-domain-containing protein n=1 Tax=Gilbertella persicaria TaxID=101096 RepID=UPI002220C5A2|nr:subunit 17 of mediator complex-domain-containing protein [Gilbertella persicaria]KAI8088072.1 subunit 17 of mediator complex-domain-containing protein [Gilbertella persicaria]
MNEHPTKKIKISLEPFIDNNVADITNLGQEIMKAETSLPEKLMQSVDRVWFERGEWKDITEDSLEKSIEKKENAMQDDRDESEQEDMPSTSIPTIAQQQQPPPGFDIVKLRESVINKLFHAKSEIDVALDVINILAAGNRSSAATTKDLVLPVGSLAATYVTRPKQTTKAQLESTQLNLGLKRTKQKQAAEFLRNSAATLKNLVEKEQVFWDEALDLRRNNWQMLPNTQPGNINAGSSFFVQYGFAEVGSDFNEASIGELKRANDTNSSKLQMSLPHANPRRVVVSVSQSHMGQLGIGRQEFSEGILGMTDREEQQEKGSDITPPSFRTNALHSDIQTQLVEAHSTVFDAELFSDVLAEAQALNSNVRFPDDEIVINIDGKIDLSIRKMLVENTSTVSEKVYSQHIISRSINLALRLLLLQHQRYNAWKIKARTLSTNPKIRQLLAQHDASLSSISSAASTTATTATAAAAAVAGTAVGTVGVSSASGASNTAGQSPQITHSAAATSVASPSTTINSNVSNSVNLSTVVGNVTGATGVGSNTSAVISAASMRARTRRHNQLVPRDLPQQIPILLPILSLTRFWVQFDRVRQVVHHLINPLCAFMPVSTHFKCELLSVPIPTKRSYDAYPGYTDVSLSLGISLFKGPSLKFGLNQSGFISVCLPQTTVVLQNVSEFEAFLSREIKVVCLRTVCDIANDIMSRDQRYLSAVESSKQRFLWQVDQVDEAIHGSVWWGHDVDPVWRNM